MAECHGVKQDCVIRSMDGGCGGATSWCNAKRIGNFDELAKQVCNDCGNELRGKADWLGGQRELSLSLQPPAAPDKEMTLCAMAVMLSFS
jgi:hypothetical protein